MKYWEELSSRILVHLKLNKPSYLEIFTDGLLSKLVERLKQYRNHIIYFPKFLFYFKRDEAVTLFLLIKSRKDLKPLLRAFKEVRKEYKSVWGTKVLESSIGKKIGHFRLKF